MLNFRNWAGGNNLLNYATIDVVKGSKFPIAVVKGKAAIFTSVGGRCAAGRAQALCVCVCGRCSFVNCTNKRLLVGLVNGLGGKRKWHLMCSNIDISSLVATTEESTGREEGGGNAGLKRSKERRPAGVAGPI